jgi:hypothetical protein
MFDRVLGVGFGIDCGRAGDFVDIDERPAPRRLGECRGLAGLPVGVQEPPGALAIDAGQRLAAHDKGVRVAGQPFERPRELADAGDLDGGDREVFLVAVAAVLDGAVFFFWLNVLLANLRLTLVSTVSRSAVIGPPLLAMRLAQRPSTPRHRPRSR